MNGIKKIHYAFNRLDIIQKHNNFNESIENDFIDNVLMGIWNDTLEEDLINTVHNKPKKMYVMTGNPELIKHFDIDYKLNKFVIIGYITLYEKHFNFNNRTGIMNNPLKILRFIDTIDTRIRGCEMGYYMITKIEKKLKKIVLPYIIAKDAKLYWKKYFEKRFNIITKQDLIKFCNEYLLGDIYDNIYDLYDN